MRDAVESHRTRQIPFRVLAEAAAAVDVSGAGTAAWRGRLADAVAELDAANIVDLPALAWDRAATPALPEWVRRPRREPVPAEVPAAVVWDARLETAAAMDAAGTLTTPERELLTAVNDWIRDDPEPLVLPVRERSWQLLGNEKALERFRRGRLWAVGALSDELLAIEPTFAPVDASDHGPDPDRCWLVVENYTTFRTLAWAAERSGWSGRLLWGAGNQVMSRLEAAVDHYGPHAGALRYFGDVDAVGLRLARDVTTLAETLGLPACRAATGLYRILLSAGDPVPEPGRVSAAVRSWLPGWLGEDLAEAAMAAAETGRLPQEAVNRRSLAGPDLADLVG